jgi:tRNA threonylcarbamoyladenosine biosynthesis protein TsaE
MDPLALPDPTAFARRRRTVGADQTRALGAAMAAVVQPGDAILLHGPLGAGKTCLVQGLCEGLGLTDEVISPTFTLVNRYPGSVTVDHLDFYRIDPGDDLDDIGVLDILDELDAGRTLLVAEWPNLLVPYLPARVDLLALPGQAADERWWHARGVPDLAPAWAALFDEAVPPC